MQDSEQWKSGGDCRVCRKHDYCRKPCSRNKRLMNTIVMEAFRKTKAGRIMAAAREEMAKAGGGPYADG